MWGGRVRKKSLIPDIILEKIWEITPELLQELCISGLIVDIDNTLALANVQEPFPGILEWLTLMDERGVTILLVSNNSGRRAATFAKGIGLRHIHRAMKPMKYSFKKAEKLLGKSTRQIAVVGDQIFTDILGGNRAGMTTILVRPLEEKSEGGAFFRLKRRLEAKYIQQYYNNLQS